MSPITATSSLLKETWLGIEENVKTSEPKYERSGGDKSTKSYSVVD